MTLRDHIRKNYLTYEGSRAQFIEQSAKLFKKANRTVRRQLLLEGYGKKIQPNNDLVEKASKKNNKVNNFCSYYVHADFYNYYSSFCS